MKPADNSNATRPETCKMAIPDQINRLSHIWCYSEIVLTSTRETWRGSMSVLYPCRCIREGCFDDGGRWLHRCVGRPHQIVVHPCRDLAALAMVQRWRASTESDSAVDPRGWMCPRGVGRRPMAALLHRCGGALVGHLACRR